MGMITILLAVVTTLLTAGAVTVVLDVLADHCFRPLETAQPVEHQPHLQ